MIQYEKPYETTMERLRRERAEKAETHKELEKQERSKRRELIGFCILVPVVFFGMLALYSIFAPIKP